MTDNAGEVPAPATGLDPERVITAFLKREHRLPLTCVETAAMLTVRGLSRGACKHGNVTHIEKRALLKIRAALEGVIGGGRD